MELKLTLDLRDKSSGELVAITVQQGPDGWAIGVIDDDGGFMFLASTFIQVFDDLLEYINRRGFFQEGGKLQEMEVFYF